MPFTYNLPVPELPANSVDSSEDLRLVRFLVGDRAWVKAGTAVAKLETSRTVIRVLANGPGMLSRKLAGPGATLKPGQNLAVIVADGESIPYDRPYSMAQIRRRRWYDPLIPWF